MQNIVIFGGGNITDYSYFENMDFSNSYVIAVDRGLEHVHEIRVNPNVLIGDLDSCSQEILDTYKNCQKIVLDRNKDFTDSQYAFDYAINLHPKEVKLIGFTGNRKDHELMNILLLTRFQQKGIRARIIDEHNEVFITEFQESFEYDKDRYFSFIPLDEIEYFNLENFEYPLESVKLEMYDSLTLSNKVVEGKTGFMSRSPGTVICIISRDKI